MGIAVLLVFFSAFIPILIGTGASKAPFSEWTDGYFISLAKEIVGPWLSYWLMLGSALTNIGMFEAEMSSDSWQIAGMADRGILPSFLGARNQYDTPTLGILLSASGIIALCWMSFSEVVDMLNLLFCYGQAIEFFAFLHLRRTKPDMPRPFKIPIGYHGMCVMLAFPLAFILVILYFSSWSALLTSGTLSLCGVGLYYLLEMARTKGWCDFEDRYAGDDNNNRSKRNSATKLDAHNTDYFPAVHAEEDNAMVEGIALNAPTTSQHSGYQPLATTASYATAVDKKGLNRNLNATYDSAVPVISYQQQR